MSPAAAPNIELATTAAARVASTTLLQADHHSYVLWFGGDAEGRQEPLLGSPNGLVYARQSDISVITGMSYGPIGLHVELHDAPPSLDLRDWEDAVELSVLVREHGLLVGETMDGNAPGVPRLDHGPGVYRVRVQARGRDETANLDVALDAPQNVDEQHAVLVWRAAADEIRVLKTTSRFGRQWTSASSTSQGLAASGEGVLPGTAYPEPPPEPAPTADELAEFRRQAYIDDGPMRIYDPRLLEALVQSSAATQRAVAAFAARQALTEAALTDLPGMPAALAALEAGQPPPPPFDQPETQAQLQLEAMQLPHTTVPLLPGLTGPSPGVLISQQAAAGPTLASVQEPDPLIAALDTLYSAMVTFGASRYRDLLQQIRDTFPELAAGAVPRPTFDQPLHHRRTAPRPRR